jgi:ATP-dependent Clp protease ATP-binding subunit ClpA
MSQIEKVRDKFLTEIYDICANKGFTLTISAQALSFLLKEGYSDQYGARPMRRVIEEKIKIPLADIFLFGSPQKGKNIFVDLSGDHLKVIQTKAKEFA